MALEFEWDLAKAELNLKEHGISFDEATTVFRDRSQIQTTPILKIALSTLACLIGCNCSSCRTRSAKIRFES